MITLVGCRLGAGKFARGLHSALARGPGVKVFTQVNARTGLSIVVRGKQYSAAPEITSESAETVRALSDKDALIAMDTENRVRKDISPYERAVSYARWLRSGYFNSQDDIARALKISASQVSRVLQLAQLPAVVVEAFVDPTQIRESWGRSLLRRVENPDTRQALADRARAIVAQKGRPAAKEVYQALIAASAKGRKPKPRHHDVVVRGESGVPLFRIRHQRDSVALKYLASCKRASR